MKRTAIVLAFGLAGISSAMAQTEKPGIEKGTGIISLDIPMDIGTSHYKSNFGESSYTFFNLSPHLSGGYFLFNNFMLGAYVGSVTGFTRSKDNVLGVNKSTTPTFIQTGIMVRYYHLFTPKIGIYGQLMAGSMIQANKFMNDDASNGTLGCSINWAPRLVITPVKQVGINLGFGDLNYSYRASRSNGKKISDEHFFRITPSLNVGVSYFIGR